MTHPVALIGDNFSGRTDWMKRRWSSVGWPHSVYIGPYPDHAGTGLAWTVGQEIILSKQDVTLQANGTGTDFFDLEPLKDRPLHELSGGESVRVCLAAAFSLRASEVQIDIALEHLDSDWRNRMFQFLRRSQLRTTFIVADNRLTADERSIFAESV